MQTNQAINDKSKQRYKVKINNIEGYDPSVYDFPPVANPDILNFYFY